MNFFDTKLEKKDDKYVVVVQGHEIKLNKRQQETLADKDVVKDVILGIRPVHVSLAKEGIEAKIDVTELMSSELHLHLNSDGKDVVVVVPTTEIDVDKLHGTRDTVHCTFKLELIHIFDKKSEKVLF